MGAGNKEVELTKKKKKTHREKKKKLLWIGLFRGSFRARNVTTHNKLIYGSFLVSVISFFSVLQKCLGSMDTADMIYWVSFQIKIIIMIIIK